MEIFVLFESAAGYVLVQVKEWDSIGNNETTVQEIVVDASRFGQVCSTVAFCPLQSADEALENMNAISAGQVTDTLKNFLELSLPKKKKKYQLGICDAALAKTLSDMGYPVLLDKNIIELHRGCRWHLNRLVKQLKGQDYTKFQVGLGHSYSRCKIQFDPNRQDKPITQSIALIDSLDKNINLFSMRVKEWYSWHFPELSRIVTDNTKFAQVVKIIQCKELFNESRRDELTELLNSDEMVDEILAAMGNSTGQEVTELDMINIDKFADQVIKLSRQREQLVNYLHTRLNSVSPNLQALVGDTLSARLISHAGSLVNLAKYPASTIQILGAEKALFRALKAKKGKTPKYGLLFQSPFIGKATLKSKGRISRYLANKCALAARMDNFLTVQTDVFGKSMRKQVEERLLFLTDKVLPRTNMTAMREAVGEYDTVLNQISENNNNISNSEEELSSD